MLSQFGAQAYYQWTWKLIEDGDQLELYNLETDPTERTDLATLELEKVAQLKILLDAWPRAESLHIPLYQVMWDPDFFGGEIDRAPWADVVEGKSNEL